MDSLGAEAAGAEEAIAAAYPLLALCRRRLGALVGARSDRRACASRRADGRGIPLARVRSTRDRTALQGVDTERKIP
jgi:hypothetical protein